jgi:hypothetical protein
MRIIKDIPRGLKNRYTTTNSGDDVHSNIILHRWSTMDTSVQISSLQISYGYRE